MDNEPGIGELSEMERRADEAHIAQDARAEAAALIDIVYALDAAGRSGESLGQYVDRAWELAEGIYAWDQLHRLSRLFAQMALREENWLRLYDHAANACAYAVMADAPRLLREAMQAIDETLLFMRQHQNAGRAVAFCDMLLAYEDAGGLGDAQPNFVAHYRAEREAAYVEAVAQRDATSRDASN